MAAPHGVTSPSTLLLSKRRDTIFLARKIAEKLEASDLVVLSGALGTGKTFCARAMLRALGVRAAVPSPTFTLVAEYATRAGRVLHADLYRLREAGVDTNTEIAKLGLREQRGEGAILIVEWADSYWDALGGEPAFALAFERAGDTARRVRIEGSKATALERA
jgi:tRNA threonylcarbamoyl adenosine modification protein YjeE